MSVLRLIVEVFLLSCSRVLEPNLRHSLAQARYLRDALEVLTIRVRVEVEVGLQNLQLFLREGGPDPFSFGPGVVLLVAVLCAEPTTLVYVSSHPPERLWPVDIDL